MVGAGAVGCELLKNLALMGVCTNSNSLLTYNVKGGNILNSELWFIF